MDAEKEARAEAREITILKIFHSGLFELFIADTGTIHAREQVRDQAKEQRYILEDKFG